MSFSDEEILGEFLRDEGALIEVYVRGTTLEDWDQAISALLAAGYEVSLDRDDVAVPVSVSAEMFTGEDMCWLLRVRVGKQDWTTTFFLASDIDFQGNPQPVSTSEDLDEFREFMRTLVHATGKSAILITESLDLDAVKPYIDIRPDAATK